MKLPAITKLNREVMKVIAQEAIDLIRSDANKGIFQNGVKNQQYGSHGDTKGRSPKRKGKYSDYKANGMRRFKDGVKLQKTKRTKYGATDTDTNFVNMNLEGRTLRSMRPGARKNTAIIRFDSASVVLGNRARKPKGYDLFDLRKENRAIIANRIADVLARTNIKKYVAKTEVMK